MDLTMWATKQFPKALRTIIGSCANVVANFSIAFVGRHGFDTKLIGLCLCMHLMWALCMFVSSFARFEYGHEKFKYTNFQG